MAQVRQLDLPGSDLGVALRPLRSKGEQITVVAVQVFNALVVGALLGGELDVEFLFDHVGGALAKTFRVESSGRGLCGHAKGQAEGQREQPSSPHFRPSAGSPLTAAMGVLGCAAEELPERFRSVEKCSSCAASARAA